MNLYRHSSFTGEDAMELGRSSTPSSSSGDYQVEDRPWKIMLFLPLLQIQPC